MQGKRKKVSHKVNKTLDVAEDNWIIINNHHKAIIDKEVFERVQDIIYERTIRVKKSNELDVFSGHLCCSECGNNLVIKKAKGYEYYYCSTYLKKKECTNHSYRKSLLEEEVLKIINNYKNVITDIENKINEIVYTKEVNYDEEILNMRIKDCDENIKKFNLLRESVKDDLNEKFITEDEYWEYSKEYSNKINEFKKQKAEYLKKIKNTTLNLDNNNEWIKKFTNKNELKTLNKKVVNELVDDIIIDKDKNIKIIFKYEDKYFEALDFINKEKCDIINNEFLREKTS